MLGLIIHQHLERLDPSELQSIHSKWLNNERTWLLFLTSVSPPNILEVKAFILFDNVFEVFDLWSFWQSHLELVISSHKLHIWPWSFVNYLLSSFDDSWKILIDIEALQILIEILFCCVDIFESFLVKFIEKFTLVISNGDFLILKR